MIKLSNVRTFLFDLDGVITNTMPFHFEAWKRILKGQGLDICDHDVYSREGQKGAESVREIFADYGRDVTPEAIAKILLDKENLFKQIVQLEFIPGSLDFLKFLSQSGYPLALVTGTARHELDRYVPDHVLNRFQVIVTGTDVKNGKPHPEPYQTALRKMNFESSQAIVIENAPLGIASAKDAGIHCLAIETSLPRKYLHRADAVFSSMEELRLAVFSDGASDFRNLKDVSSSCEVPEPLSPSQ